MKIDTSRAGSQVIHGRQVNAATVVVHVGAGLLRAPLEAGLHGPAGRPVPFDQSLVREMKGMPAG